MKKVINVMFILAILSLAACPLMGVEEAATTSPADATQQNISTATFAVGKGLAIGGACMGAGLAAIGGGFAVARIGAACIDATARQPEAASSMFAPMIVTAAMVEGGMLFAIVICLMGVLFI